MTRWVVRPRRFNVSAGVIVLLGAGAAVFTNYATVDLPAWMTERSWLVWTILGAIVLALLIADQVQQRRSRSDGTPQPAPPAVASRGDGSQAIVADGRLAYRETTEVVRPDGTREYRITEIFIEDVATEYIRSSDRQDDDD